MISFIIWIVALFILWAVFKGISCIIDEIVVGFRDWRGHEQYRPRHPYDWKRNGL